MKRFKLVEHTADVGVEARGHTLEDLFASTAEGMFSIMTDLDRVKETESVRLLVRGEGPEELLIAFLSELLYRHEIEGIFFKRVEIARMDNRSLEAEAVGERVNLKRHALGAQIKAATYHQLSITHNEEWESRVIFDI